MALAGEVEEGSGDGGGLDDAGGMHAIVTRDELLDGLCREGVVVDAHVVHLALQQWVGSELAAADG